MHSAAVSVTFKMEAVNKSNALNSERIVLDNVLSYHFLLSWKNEMIIQQTTLFLKNPVENHLVN